MVSACGPWPWRDNIGLSVKDKTTLFLKMDENTTREVRFMTITFEAGDYFDYVHIKQLVE